MSKTEAIVLRAVKETDVTHLTNVQLAKRYQVHPGTIANWRVMGFGPKWMKMGKRILYPLKEVEAFEKGQMKRTTF